MSGFFKYAYSMSQNPIDGSTDYVWFGFAVLLSPILAPLWYLGKLAEWVLNDE